MISLFRKLQYQELAKLSLDGKVIDLGGSRKSGYHELIKGNRDFVVANISDYYGYDVKVDLEKRFPFEDSCFDNAIAINMVEHIYHYTNVFKETNRVLKKDGLFVFTSPFLFHKHGCPQDFNRFTDDALKRIATDNGFGIISIQSLGEGIFSVFYQMLPIPAFLRPPLEFLFVSIDRLLKFLSKGYQKMSEEYPLGYYVILKKQ